MVFEPVTTVTIEEVAGDFSRLEADWHQLWRELENPTPFQTFAWINACNQAFGEANARALICHAPGRVVGILPLVGTDTLKLAGGAVSDYQDALVAPGFERMVMLVLVEHFREQQHCWRELHFENLPPESALLFGHIGEACSDMIESRDVCPTLGLAGPQEIGSRFPQAIPAQQREKAHQSLRRAQKAGKVEIETVTFETLDLFLDSHKASEKLLRMASPGLLRSEILRMYFLRLDQRIVARYFGFHCGSRSFFYLSEHDPEVRDLQPDTILIGHAIEEAVREGAATFDFLRGAEPFKYDWGAHDTHTYCRKIVRL